MKLSALCAGSEHCESEIRTKLMQWGLSSDSADKIVDRLVDGNYINDVRYGKCFVRDKFRYNKWGRMKIKQALMQKGLSSQIIAGSLEEIEEQEYESVLLDLLRKKNASVTASTDFERRAKLMRFGAGRGFEPALIGRCLDRLGCAESDYFE